MAHYTGSSGGHIPMPQSSSGIGSLAHDGFPWDERYIYQLIYHKNQPNVAKYTSPMNPMGRELVSVFDFHP